MTHQIYRLFLKSLYDMHLRHTLFSRTPIGTAFDLGV